MSNAKLKVSKFGGTSLATAEMIRKVGEIIKSDPQRRAIVVSAPGKRHKDDIKVTDLLIACANAHLKTGSADKELTALVERFDDIVNELGMPKSISELIEADLKERVASNPGSDEKYIDQLKAAGEDNCAKLMAGYLRTLGVEANYVSPKDVGLLLSDEYANAQVLPESYENLKSLRDAPGVTVFPGFFGYSPDGSLVTFPRGGSDITGAILAASVQADLYENFTDVDSVFAADPRIVDNPRAITELSYREMRELSYAGFGVFHAEALAPVIKARISICIKNTNNPSAPGTMILPEREHGNGPAAGIASDSGFCTIYVSKYMMNREVGFGRKLLQILEEEGLSYEHTPSGIDNISVVLHEDYLTAEKEKHVIERIHAELDVDDVYVERGLALVMVVGEGMRHHLGISAKAANAFAEVGANIEMINQGSSEVSMMFGIKAEDTGKAVRGLYETFFRST